MSLAGERLPGTPLPMHRWEGNGVQIAGDSWGDPAGPLVLLLHGGGQTRHAWKGAGETLGRAGYHAIALDARGHGDSGWAPDGDYHQDAMLADLLAVIAQIGKPRPVLVGASMGGGLGLVAVGEDHVDATALVLVDIAPRIERDGVGKILAFMNQKPEGFESLEEVAEAIASYQPHRTRPRDLAGLAKNLRRGSDGRLHWHWDPAIRGLDSKLKMRGDRLTECARNLRLPTLLVRGGLSDIVSEEGAREFLDLCPHSEFVNITGAGHMVAGDRNDVFSGAVVDFLRRTVPVGAQPVQPPHALHPRHLGPDEPIVDVP